MTLARRDVEATASAGVWRSPSPLPLKYLVVTVRSAAGGAVNVWWSTPVSSATSAPPPDRTIAATQSLAIEPGLGTGTLYIADVTGGAFDVEVAADTEPMQAAATTPPNAGDAYMATITEGQGQGHSHTLPIPVGCRMLGIYMLNGSTVVSPTLRVFGHQSGLDYYNGPITQRRTYVFVSPALDASVDLVYGDGGTPGGSTVFVVGLLDGGIVASEPGMAAQRVYGSASPLASGGSVVVLPTSGAVYNLRKLTAIWDAAAGTPWAFQGIVSGAPVFAGGASVAGNAFVDFDESELGPGEGLTFKNYGPNALTMRWTLTFRQDWLT